VIDQFGHAHARGVNLFAGNTQTRLLRRIKHLQDRGAVEAFFPACFFYR